MGDAHFSDSIARTDFNLGVRGERTFTTWCPTSELEGGIGKGEIAIVWMSRFSSRNALNPIIARHNNATTPTKESTGSKYGAAGFRAAKYSAENTQKQMATTKNDANL